MLVYKWRKSYDFTWWAFIYRLLLTQIELVYRGDVLEGLPKEEKNFYFNLLKTAKGNCSNKCLSSYLAPTCKIIKLINNFAVNIFFFYINYESELHWSHQALQLLKRFVFYNLSNPMKHLPSRGQSGTSNKREGKKSEVVGQRFEIIWVIFLVKTPWKSSQIIRILFLLQFSVKGQARNYALCN